jgi:hypothetical protein
VLTIQTRSVPTDKCWFAWISGRHGAIRLVRSIEDVRGLMETFGCQHVEWPDGSYEQMVQAGVAPVDPPRWLT